MGAKNQIWISSSEPSNLAKGWMESPKVIARTQLDVYGFYWPIGCYQYWCTALL